MDTLPVKVIEPMHEETFEFKGSCIKILTSGERLLSYVRALYCCLILESIRIYVLELLYAVFICPRDLNMKLYSFVFLSFWNRWNFDWVVKFTPHAATNIDSNLKISQKNCYLLSLVIIVGKSWNTRRDLLVINSKQRAESSSIIWRDRYFVFSIPQQFAPDESEGLNVVMQYVHMLIHEYVYIFTECSRAMYNRSHEEGYEDLLYEGCKITLHRVGKTETGAWTG